MKNSREIDSLSLESSLEEVLRFLFSTSLTSVFLCGFRRRAFFLKEELMAYVETEQRILRIGDVLELSDMPQNISEKMTKRPPFQKILVLTEAKGYISRIMDIFQNDEPFLPSWWDAPFPLLFRTSEKVYANPQAITFLQGYLEDMREQLHQIVPQEEHIVTCSDGRGKEGRFFLKQIEDSLFLVEDISSEMYMAEDLVRWAAIGKALHKYLEAKGIALSFSEEDPWKEGGALSGEGTVVLPCSWEEEPLGYLCLSLEQKKVSPGEETP